VLVLAAIVAGVVVWRSQVQAREDRHGAAARFVTAWNTETTPRCGGR